MVCIASACPSPNWHQDFIRMLPTIVRHAKFSFRRLRSEARAEFLALGHRTTIRHTSSA